MGRAWVCWEIKDTTHKELCGLCEKPILKGQERLRFRHCAWRTCGTKDAVHRDKQ
jgi:hypothetical protein